MIQSLFIVKVDYLEFRNLIPWATRKIDFTKPCQLADDPCNFDHIIMILSASINSQVGTRCVRKKSIRQTVDYPAEHNTMICVNFQHNVV